MRFFSKTLIFNRRGFTLIEALVGMVMIAGGMLAMVTVSDIQSDSNRRTRFYNQTERLVNDVDTLLKNSEACRRTVMGPTLAGADSLAELQENVRDQISRADGTGFIRRGDTYDAANAGIVRVNDIIVQPAPGYPNWANGTQAYTFTFVVEPTVDLGNTIPQIRRSLPAPVYVVISGGIDLCVTGLDRMLEEVKRETCESTGGVYRANNANYCIFAGNDNTPQGDRPPVNLPITDNDPDTDNQFNALARDVIEGTNPTNPYSRYLETNSASQTITGPVSFSGLNGNGIQINNVGSYPAPSNSATNVNDPQINSFESRVPNHNWIANPANFREMLRHGANGGSYCDEQNLPVMVMLTDTGAQCVNIPTTLQCPPGINYLRGFNPNGSPICTPLIGGTTSCAQGQSYSLVANVDGTLGLQCVACTDTSEWIDIGAPTCSCTGVQEQMQYCLSRCGQPCPGGGQYGDTRRTVSSSTCTPSAGCSGGTGGGPCTDGASCSTVSDCGGAPNTCVPSCVADTANAIFGAPPASLCIAADSADCLCSNESAWASPCTSRVETNGGSGPHYNCIEAGASAGSCTGTPTSSSGFCGTNATPTTYTGALPRIVTANCGASGSTDQASCEGLMEQGSTSTTYHHCQWSPATCSSMGFDSASCNSVSGCSWNSATSSGGTCACSSPPPPSSSSSSSSGPTPSSGGSCSGYSGFDMCGSTCLGKPLLTPVADSCCSGLSDYGDSPNAPCE